MQDNHSPTLENFGFQGIELSIFLHSKTELVWTWTNEKYPNISISKMLILELLKKNKCENLLSKA